MEHVESELRTGYPGEGGFPSGLAVRIHLQCSRHRFDPWVGKIPCRGKWQLTPVFLSGKPHGQRGLAGFSLWCPKRVGHDLGTKEAIAIQVKMFNGHCYICI